MGKALYAKGNGDIMIWDKLAGDNADTIIGDPNAYIDRVKFHSDFNYLNVFTFFSLTVVQPVIPPSVPSQIDIYNLYTGAIGDRLWLMFDDWGAKSVPHYYRNNGIRQTVFIDNTGDNIQLQVSSFNFDLVGVAGFTHTFTGAVLSTT